MRSYAGWNKRLAKRYDQWMIAMHYAPETKSKYRKTIRIFMEFLADKSAARVTHWDIRRFIGSVSENGASLDATYRHLSVVRLFYDFLNLGGVVSYVAPRLVRLRRPLKNPGPMLTESQVRRLLAATQTLRERAVVELFYGSGCRLSEAIHLRVENIDLVDKVARVRGKFGKVRSVLLTKNSAEALQAYIGDRQTGFVFRQDLPRQKGCVAKRGNYWVGLWVDYSGPGPEYRRQAEMLGRIDLVPYESAKSELNRRLEGAALARPEIDRPLSKMAIGTLLLKVGERAGLRNVGAHMLRRSFATHLHDHGASLEVIQKLLGHTYITTTARYTQLSTGRLAKTFERCHPRRRMNGQDDPGRPQESTKTQEGERTPP